jgi:small multidrug resistance family-3 protein
MIPGFTHQHLEHCRIGKHRGQHMISIAAYIGAALAEIAGCFAFWAWLRLDKSVWWLVPGMAALALFAYLLTFAEVTAAGRAYAAYGGVYIAASLGWLWLVEGTRPDRWDSLGVLICLLGTGIILFAPRPT